ncbi:uncharacterized protein B0I36DRAFT_319334 [Microdochium trichocladiopsis]|uniref:FAD-binding domain-containing protein n=1 Tax=Microdochium trichocladiopsis TaxID=1682393 RepID=A0A9P9BTF5_9PEZI|nr:uncharacterized protein B0I36DRAFT_319334 [Microdochium trichocladiopsis]KAH7035910.1 hypothetical protein B0I36DRAFT_319334 [Microdochium trichocladiopsis]
MASQENHDGTAAAAGTGAVQTHQVIIVGGGITGLTMALMLQRLGIDYILLEAYGSVTPQHGASVGLYPNGLRILDQLGLFEGVQAAAVTTRYAVWRDATKGGKRMMTRSASDVIKARHGYANLFLARHDLLNVLYGGIEDKERLLVNKRVTKVDSLEDCARVHTTDGTVYEGQIVVGADGVRSFVRQEMWRHAGEQEQKQTQTPTTTTTTTTTTTSEKASKKKQQSKSSSPFAIPASDKGDVPCEHACIFGTARPKPGFHPGDMQAVCGTRTTTGLMCAANGDIFFFWFWTLPAPDNKCPITAIPRITEEDKQRELERCKDTIVTDDGMKLGEVLADVKFSGVTALPHFVLERWHAGRLVLIGDSAHKFNPLVGQGGNSCFESCAALVNELQTHVLGPKGQSEKVSSSSSAWSLPALHAAFSAVEEERIPRVKEMVERSQVAMRRVAWESWKPKVLQRYIAPLLPLNKVVDFYSWFITPGIRLRGESFSPPPALDHSIPYEDEKKAPHAAVAAVAA